MTRNCGKHALLVGRELLISTGEPNENVMVKYLTKHIAYVFYKFHIHFFLSVFNGSIQNI